MTRRSINANIQYGFNIENNRTFFLRTNTLEIETFSFHILRITFYRKRVAKTETYGILHSRLVKIVLQNGFTLFFLSLISSFIFFYCTQILYRVKDGYLKGWNGLIPLCCRSNQTCFTCFWALIFVQNFELKRYSLLLSRDKHLRFELFTTINKMNDIT